MDTKKIIGLIVSILLVGAFGFCLSWTIINWDKVQDGISGTGLYTQDDLNKAYQDGYDTALTNEGEYTALIDEYRDTVLNLNDTIAQLNSQVAALVNTNGNLNISIANLQNQKSNLESTVATLTETSNGNLFTISSLYVQVAELQTQINSLTLSGDNKEIELASLNTQITTLQNIIAQLQNTNSLNLATITSLNEQIASLNGNINSMLATASQTANTITALNNRIADLESSVSYYQHLITAMQVQGKVVATFMFNEAVYNVQVVDENTTVSVATPQSTTYIIFNGWSVDGTTPVNLATYTLTENTTFTALLTYKYDVKFMYEATVHNTQIITKNGFATVSAPQNTTHKEFKGWSVDGNTIVNLATYPITQNTTFYAVIDYKVDVTFTVDSGVYNSQIVVIGNKATIPTAPAKVGHTFKGWAVSGTVVDVANYVVQTSTTFTAIFELNSYAVTFLSNGATYTTQTISHGGNAATPTAPTRTGYTFGGWSLNGTTALNLAATQITANTTFTAIWNINTYSVTFVSNGSTHATQTVSHNGTATTPNNPTRTGYTFSGWSLNGTTVISLATSQITQETTFTAVWTINTYTVTFTSQGSTHATQTVSYNGTATTPSVPTRTGYSFGGWSLNGTTVVNLGTTQITQNTTFTAVWTVLSYTVTFKSEGNTHATRTVEYGGYATAPANPSKQGGSFLYWSLDGVNAVNLSTLQITGNTTVVAVFEAIWWTAYEGNGVFLKDTNNGAGNTINLATLCGGSVEGKTIEITFRQVVNGMGVTATFPVFVNGSSHSITVPSMPVIGGASYTVQRNGNTLTISMTGYLVGATNWSLEILSIKVLG